LTADRIKPFYGYWIVLAAFLCNIITFGCGFYAFSLFVTPLQQQLGWGRGDVMVGFTVFFLTTGLVAPQAGRLVDRYGARVVMSAGAAVAGLGFLVLSSMSALWQYYVGYAIIGLGMAATGQIPASAVVSNWFERRRGAMVGLMASGVGVGGLVLAPLVGAVLLPQLGWSHSYLILGILCWLGIIPLAVFVIRTRPEEKGLRAYGAAELPPAWADAKSAPKAGVSLKIAMTTMTFWLIFLTYLISQFAQVGTIQNQVPLLEDAGFPVAVSAGAMGAVGLCSAFAKFGFGWLCDRVQAKNALAIGLVLQVMAIMVLMTIGPGSRSSMAWLYAITMGLGIGSWLPTMSMLVSGYFGLAHYGAIFGAVTVPYAVGSAVGPLVAGRMYDASGSYDSVLLLFLSLFLASIVTILITRKPAVQ